MPRSILWLLLGLIAASPAWAEVRTIAATGEYRMGDNDTRTDAKRLALLDAKRLALEQAGTYLESVTEVKNLQVSHDELRAYTAGIIEVTEQITEDVMEGATHVLRVQVIAKIDAAVVMQQINALRQNERAKAELERLREEGDRLRTEVESLNKEITIAKSKAEADLAAKQRREALAKADGGELIARGWVAMFGSEKAQGLRESTSPEGRAIVLNLAKEALDHNHLRPSAHYLLGIVRYEEGTYAAAITELETAVRLEPRIARYHLGLGVALEAKGDYPGAMSEYRTALSLEPDYAAARTGLGNVLATTGDTAAAIAEYRKVLQRWPDDAAVHNNLGIALHAVGNLREAIAEYRAALRLQPDYAEAHTNLAWALGKIGDIDGASAEASTAVKLRPSHANGHYVLGLVLKHRGFKQAAAGEFREYLRLVSPAVHNRQNIEYAKSILHELER